MMAEENLLDSMDNCAQGEDAAFRSVTSAFPRPKE